MKWLFRFRKVQWPRAIKAPVDPVKAAFSKQVKAHFILCVACDDRAALSEIHSFPGSDEAGHVNIDRFIKENTTDEVWFKLRGESLSA